MRVFATYDIVRDAILVHCELEVRADGTRLFHAPSLHGARPDVMEVAPGAEAPAFACIPAPMAAEVANALRRAGLAMDPVTLETWGDFAAIVDRVMA